MKKWIYIAGLSLFILYIGGCTSTNGELKEPPSIIIKINGEELESAKGGYEWSVEKWFTTETAITDAMAPNQIAEELKLRAGKVNKDSVAAISFNDRSKSELQVFLWNEKKVVKELPISGQEIILPSATGRHVIEVRSKWSNGEASYTFVVEVI